MKIGIIGSGDIGGTLTRRLRELGHDATVANSRGPGSLAGLAAFAGLAGLAAEAGATAGTADEAARGGDVAPVYGADRDADGVRASLAAATR